MIWTFLLIYILPFLALTLLVEAEWFGWATTSMVASIAIYSWLHRLDIFPFFKENGIFCLEAAGAYILAGVVWSFVKWFLFLMKFRGKFREAKADYIAELGLPSGSNVPEDKVQIFVDRLRHINVNGYQLSYKPKAADSKNKIIAWMAFWPCSVIGYLFNDPVRRLFNAIFTALRESYQKMSDKIIDAPELK